MQFSLFLYAVFESRIENDEAVSTLQNWSRVVSVKHAAWCRKLLFEHHVTQNRRCSVPSERDAGRENPHSLSFTRNAGFYAFEPEKSRLRKPRAGDRTSLHHAYTNRDTYPQWCRATGCCMRV